MTDSGSCDFRVKDDLAQREGGSNRTTTLSNYAVNEHELHGPSATSLERRDMYSRPGAFAIIPGQDTTYTESGNIGQEAQLEGQTSAEEGRAVQENPQTDEPVFYNVSARVVDEADEAERNHRLERQERRLREIEEEHIRERQRVRELEVRVALQQFRHQEHERNSGRTARCKGRVRFVGYVLSFIIVVVAAISIGILVPSSKSNNSMTDLIKTDPTSTAPTLPSTESPTAAPTQSQSTSPTPPLPPWIKRGQDLHGSMPDVWFGEYVALSADGGIVAGFSHGIDGAGRVRVFEYDIALNQWIQKGQDLEGEATQQGYHGTLALSANGTIVAIGAPEFEGKGGEYSGRVRVYLYDKQTTRWQKFGPNLDGEVPSEYFGGAVDISADGTVLAVGAGDCFWHYNTTESGPVRVFRYIRGTDVWAQMGQSLTGESSERCFGGPRSVALSDNGITVAVSSVGIDDTGRFRVFGYDNVANWWNQLGQNLEGKAEGGWLSLALSGDSNTVATGYPENDSYGWKTGFVRVFSFQVTTNEWTQMGNDLVGEDEWDLLGTAVALSTDGSILAAGGSVDGEEGTVRVFRYDRAADVWRQRGQTIYGSDREDGFGEDVEISAEGNIVAVGANGNDENGLNSGRVQVFILE